jgi:hypothetical protein
MEILLKQLNLSKIYPKETPKGLLAKKKVDSGYCDCGSGFCQCQCDCGYCPCSHCK